MKSCCTTPWRYRRFLLVPWELRAGPGGSGCPAAGRTACGGDYSTQGTPKKCGPPARPPSWHQRSATAGTSPDGDVGSNEGRGLSCYGVGPCGSARRGQEKNGAGGEVAWISGVGEGLPGAALVHPDEDPQRERSAGICGSGGCHSAGIDGAE